MLKWHQTGSRFHRESRPNGTVSGYVLSSEALNAYVIEMAAHKLSSGWAQITNSRLQIIIVALRRINNRLAASNQPLIKVYDYRALKKWRMYVRREFWLPRGYGYSPDCSQCQKVKLLMSSPAPECLISLDGLSSSRRQQRARGAPQPRPNGLLGGRLISSTKRQTLWSVRLQKGTAKPQIVQKSRAALCSIWRAT